MNKPSVFSFGVENSTDVCVCVCVDGKAQVMHFTWTLTARLLMWTSCSVMILMLQIVCGYYWTPWSKDCARNSPFVYVCVCSCSSIFVSAKLIRRRGEWGHFLESQDSLLQRVVWGLRLGVRVKGWGTCYVNEGPHKKRITNVFMQWGWRWIIAALLL